LEAFIVEAQCGTPSLFVSKLENILQKVGKVGGDVAAWQESLSVMRRWILPYLRGQSLQRAEDLWQQARVTIAITAQWAQAHHAFQIEKQATVLREIGYELITMFDIPQLMATLSHRSVSGGCFQGGYIKAITWNSAYPDFGNAFRPGHRWSGQGTFPATSNIGIMSWSHTDGLFPRSICDTGE